MMLSNVWFHSRGYLITALFIIHHVTVTAASDQFLKSRDHAYQAVTLTSGLKQPWGMAFLPDNQGILITEKAGKIRLYRGGLQLETISGGPSATEFGQGGLLDIAVHPNFTKNGHVFFSFVVETLLR